MCPQAVGSAIPRLAKRNSYPMKHASPNADRHMSADTPPLLRRDLLKGISAGLALLLSARSHADSAKERHMKRVFITGSTDGLGLAAARTLMSEGHEVVL